MVIIVSKNKIMLSLQLFTLFIQYSVWQQSVYSLVVQQTKLQCNVMIICIWESRTFSLVHDVAGLVWPVELQPTIELVFDEFRFKLYPSNNIEFE